MMIFCLYRNYASKALMDDALAAGFTNPGHFMATNVCSFFHKLFTISVLINSIAALTIALPQYIKSFLCFSVPCCAQAHTKFASFKNQTGCNSSSHVFKHTSQ